MRISDWSSDVCSSDLINFNYQNATISSFPYLMEAYFRTYADPVLSVAGGYRFVRIGDEVLLDGSRSLSKGKDSIESYSWKLHDGTVVDRKSTRLNSSH